MFNKILIANRGEIATRIIKTLKKMYIQTVAVYSIVDVDSLHVQQADEAYFIGEAASANSYLNINAIIDVAIKTKAQAIHPGFGFLSENKDFAKACQKANIVFIGPGINAMNSMASKQLAKQILEDTSVPLIPGYHGTKQDDDFLLAKAQKTGFPILLKAAAGGGGKGMREVNTAEDFQQALKGARREALQAFGDDTMIIEKNLIRPRHIEVQIVADNHNNIVHLFSRDCSIQRRHQKIIEEANAPLISEKLADALYEAAIAVSAKINYTGAGTIEFLVDANEDFYFLEMNTRLQVEHPVTEMITNIDLVEWQVRIANNEKLPLSQEQIKHQGHAIECRIYAEDPENNFLPSTGKITFLHEPHNKNIRIDSGVKLNSEISMYYDPMIAKLITFGTNRESALATMRKALAEYYIGGIKHNIEFLKAIFANENFQNLNISTNFLTENIIAINEIDNKRALCNACALEYLTLVKQTKSPLLNDTFGWQMHLQSAWPIAFLIGSEKFNLQITPHNNNSFSVKIADDIYKLSATFENNLLTVNDGVQINKTLVEFRADSFIFYDNNSVEVKKYNFEIYNNHNTSNNNLTSPMPAKVVSVLKNKGDKVKTGESLIIIEAMKMEHTIKAPIDGIIKEVFYHTGEQVTEGAELVALEKD